MTFIEEVFKFWVKLGVLDVILPFILVFTILFAMLQRTEVLGKDKQRINAMVSFTISFITIAAISITDIITTLAQYSALAIIAFVVVAVLLSFMGAKNLGNSKFLIWSALIVMLIIAISALGWWKYFDPGFISQRVVTPLIMIAIFCLVIWFIIRGDNETVSSAVDKATAKDGGKKKGPDKKKDLDMADQPDRDIAPYDEDAKDADSGFKRPPKDYFAPKKYKKKHIGRYDPSKGGFRK